MGGLGTIIQCSSQRKDKRQSLQIMYFLEGGLLMVGNLLQTDAWVDDEMRTHCSVCVQQFLPFRRRHHCRTCGEVVCGGCSSQRAIRLTDMNVECETRVCTFCIIRATDASIKANDAAMRETSLEHRRLSTVSVLSLASPAVWRDKQMTLLSAAESEITTGSVVQLWPQPVPANETARLQVARHSIIRSAEVDPTMNLLVSIVARTLECPAAFIGIMDDSSMWIKASVGLDDRVTHIPRDDCICAHTVMEDATMIVDDTSTDKYFHAGGHAVGSSSMRYYAGAPIRVRGHGIGVVCALDTEPHSKTTDAMKSTLEAVANIVSEVLEQRVASDGTMDSLAEVQESTGLSCYSRRRTNHTSVDLHASLHGLNLPPPSRLTSSPEEANSYDATHRSPYLPQQHASKITTAMDYFHQLQMSAWTEQNPGIDMSNNGSIRTFRLLNQEKQVTRSVMKMPGSCTNVLAQLLDYEDALLYRQIFAHVSSQRELSGQTWVNSVAFHPNFREADNENLHVLTHWREYPDGSNVVVAISDESTEMASENDLLFGWFVAPCGRRDDADSVNVSCITVQPQEPQRSVSLDLLRCLNQKIAMSRFFHLPREIPTSIKPSALKLSVTPGGGNHITHQSADSLGSLETQSGHDYDSATASTSGSIDYTRGTSIDSSQEVDRSTNASLPESNRAALVALHQTGQVSQLNENEQMLLDLLDKTINTQEILAQRQHEMASVIDRHGNQLQRISSSLDRVESLLSLKVSKRARNVT
ncbi:Lateral signaling target protein 2-like protein [Phytophthora ramorum]|uniref:Lateral signaling target protein 2-like protein n=1 Tax=Phytophthora ramorum TaxID=164328 RepID=UPI0030ACCBDD|nr:Lateral signaling target protein 2-like protein [Phytophthora ramorum]